MPDKISNYKSYGKGYNERLIPLGQATDYVKISGFISKPEYAEKSRGEQYFFVNKVYQTRVSSSCGSKCVQRANTG